MDYESQPLIDEAGPEKQDAELNTQRVSQRLPLKISPWAWFAIAQVFLVVMYTVVSAVVVRRFARLGTAPKDAIANLHVQHDSRTYDILNSSEYAGPPDP
ncbi:hypothetical protein N0V90_011252 [Kalmusia sp. IMI 367209]|nr:hypothetical protein N0V90_011252 [Kalmusia sp. IMI 367209]